MDLEDPTRWTIGWNLDRGGDLGVVLRDEHGLRNLEPIRFRVDTIPDRAPSTTISTPASDRLVTPSAVIAVQAEARDDVGLSAFSIEASVRRAGVISSTSILASVDAATFEIDEGLVETSLGHDFDLASLSVEVGDDVELVAIAADERPGVDGGIEPVRSAVRRLRGQ